MEINKSRESIAFGKAVREARRSLGLSQDDFAAVSHLHRTYVGGIERGERNPTLSTIWRISAALKLTPEVLIERARLILEARAQS
jgi:transcriptional regulator with XRE-family HTH domain